jgi:ubiquinol-cytochrome c reductase cytochrome c subunit
MRHHMFRVALAAFAAIVVLGPGAALAASAEKGKATFVRFGCWQCHGFQGQGSVATSNAKTLAPDPLPWERFSALVRTSNNGMPPYTEKVLSNDDLADIYAYYLQSIPKPADYKSIPLLNQ